jgi:hypothetical protein
LKVVHIIESYEEIKFSRKIKCNKQLISKLDGRMVARYTGWSTVIDTRTNRKISIFLAIGWPDRKVIRYCLVLLV